MYVYSDFNCSTEVLRDHFKSVLTELKIRHFSDENELMIKF